MTIQTKRIVKIAVELEEQEVVYTHRVSEMLMIRRFVKKLT